MKYKKRFYRVYDKLPEAEKKMPIIPPTDGRLETWIDIERAVWKKTKIGQEALNWLVKQEII